MSVLTCLSCSNLESWTGLDVCVLLASITGSEF